MLASVLKYSLVIFISTLVLIILFSCGNEETKREQLARKYCSSCHLFPEPSLLDKATWKNGVLPQMAFRMGVDYSLLIQISEVDQSEVMKTLPAQAMLTEEEWKSIEKYYLENAPDSLTLTTQKILRELHQFNPIEYSLHNNDEPLVTMIRYDSLKQQLFVGDRFSRLYQLNSSLVKTDSFQLSSPASAMIFPLSSDPIITTIGIMDPNDQAEGQVNYLKPGERKLNAFIDSLKRPVYLEKGDLNNDHYDDYVIAAFGNYSGALYAYEKTGKEYKQHVIHRLPGTRKTIMKDVNGDGLKDVIALITQGNEQISIFINEGNFKFSPKILLRFPPVYGSSYFDLADFNSDGKFDVLYTNGDNADFSPIFKPYHGVRIFLQKENLKFEESWFFPMYGASQALARDFDKDGDMDIAAISFFPDFNKNPEQGFLYFENKDNKFQPFTTALGASGRWITIEAADIDHDSDDDLLLGALNFPGGVPKTLLQQWREKKTSIVLLKNKLH